VCVYVRQDGDRAVDVGLTTDITTYKEFCGFEKTVIVRVILYVFLIFLMFFLTVHHSTDLFHLPTSMHNSFI